MSVEHDYKITFHEVDSLLCTETVLTSMVAGVGRQGRGGGGNRITNLLLNFLRTEKNKHNL